MSWGRPYQFAPKRSSVMAVTSLAFYVLSLVAQRAAPWMWASSHNGDLRHAAHGYEPTRGAAMAAFAKSWRREEVMIEFARVRITDAGRRVLAKAKR